MIKKLLSKRSKGNAEMSFMDHVEELRWHAVRALLAIMVVAIGLFINKSFLFDTLLLGPKNADFLTYRIFCYAVDRFHLDPDLCIQGINFKLINRDLSAPFMIHLQSAFTVALVLVFPYVIWELWRFIEPALYDNERKHAGSLVLGSSLLFYFGASFGYFLVTPFSVNFLGTYQISPEIENTVDISSYIATVTGLVLACGLVFEFPLIIYFLSRIGLVSPLMMKTSRKYALVGILLLAAVITPSPDMFSQLLVAVPLYILYELSIVVSAKAYKEPEVEEVQEEVGEY